jgi:threonylcarbamoyladenosine tRNA methylthiotransferase MtaB
MQYKVFGCKVNKYYTDKWLNSEQLSWKNGIFVASCVVTDKAKRKWVKFVRQQIPSLNPEEKVWISGCGAFERGKENKTFFEIYPELSAWQEHIEILWEDPDEWKKVIQPKISTLKLPQIQLTTKKFVLIQRGCDSFCTFCLTVQKRGRHFFRDKDDILEEILQFERTGGKEVVLTGVNLSAWWLDTTNDVGTSRFAELLTYILKKSDIQRLRISSLWPEFINDAVIKIFKNPRIYPHFHFSIQSGSSDVLKAMKRHYDGVYMENLLQKIREIPRKDGVSISIGADIIVGFPGETEATFLETYDMVRDFQITKLHAFPFSPHKYGESVPAGFYPNQIEESIKTERLHRLLELGKQVRYDFISSQIGQQFEVLIEGSKESWWKGWTQNYIEVTQDNFEITSGTVKKNEIVIWVLKWVIEAKWNDDFGM